MADRSKDQEGGPPASSDEREGHLQVPRKHVERIVGEERGHKLGVWIGNQRSRAVSERMELLSANRMRWS
ncbi:helicase associated domain-containing protein [Streptomyces tendae]|uniref:helicase associated domain-containing protein n=1 Tax=Streptomyces tendae TaxID=1932 RepID=UPI0037A63C75